MQGAVIQLFKTDGALTPDEMAAANSQRLALHMAARRVAGISLHQDGCAVGLSFDTPAEAQRFIDAVRAVPKRRVNRKKNA